MPEKKNGAIHVRELSLRIPGNAGAPGYQVANDVVWALAQESGHGMHRRLAAANLRVQVPANTGHAEMSATIAKAIAKALRK